MAYVVMRLPVLMEDEGRQFLIGIRDTREEADQLIKEYTEDDKGYFKKSDLVVYEERYDCPIHGLQDSSDCPRC